MSELARLSSEFPHTFATFKLGADVRIAVLALADRDRDSPAAVISELELNGYAIERVYEHGRLLGLRLVEPDDADTGARGRRHWWSRRHR